jgi:hypothetical protein
MSLGTMMVFIICFGPEREVDGGGMMYELIESMGDSTVEKVAEQSMFNALGTKSVNSA